MVFYFDANATSPITLLELGYCIGSGKNIVVCCPDGYFRKGNVVITCRMAGIEPVNDYDEFVIAIKNKIDEIHDRQDDAEIYDEIP